MHLTVRASVILFSKVVVDFLDEITGMFAFTRILRLRVNSWIDVRRETRMDVSSDILRMCVVI